ncbi:MAG: MbnP family protein [Saprospiraceae bacterium]
MKKTKILNSSLLLLLVMLLLTACYEPQEGCLDVTATNFEADADDECPDCCQYPFLKLMLTHTMGDTSLTLGGIYQNPTDSNQYFKVINARFYLSALQLVRADGSQKGVNDKISLTVLDDQGIDETISVEDNFNLISRTSFNLTVGDFRAPANYDSLRFYVGIPQPANSADPSLVTTDHPLQADATLHSTRTEGYVFMDLQVTRDSLPVTDTLSLKIQGDQNLIAVALENIQTVNPGFDAEITLNVDYLEWFRGINFAVDTEAEMINKIVNNAANAFSVDQ